MSRYLVSIQGAGRLTVDVDGCKISSGNEMKWIAVDVRKIINAKYF
jgi:hypothetical protein